MQGLLLLLTLSAGELYGKGTVNSLTTVSGDLWKGINFLRCCLLRNVTLPEPSMRTTYW